MAGKKLDEDETPESTAAWRDSCDKAILPEVKNPCVTSNVCMYVYMFLYSDATSSFALLCVNGLVTTIIVVTVCTSMAYMPLTSLLSVLDFYLNGSGP